MTTLIIHGTMTVRAATKSSWWQTSWQEGGALNAMRSGYHKAGFDDDIWKVGGQDVSVYSSLEHDRRRHFSRDGKFYWGGFNQKEARIQAGDQLANYLNAIHEIAPYEPLRIVAHSHGCNVVKTCTQSKNLDPRVRISMLAFLACPHFQIPLSKKLPYRLDPGRVGSALNLFSQADVVQDGISDLIPNFFGGGFDDWTRSAHRRDPDPKVMHLYENHEVHTEDEGVKSHTAMHGSLIFYLLGLWLAQRGDFQSILDQHQHQFPVPKGDFGA